MHNYRIFIFDVLDASKNKKEYEDIYATVFCIIDD
jgi:hypothetical protein